MSWVIGLFALGIGTGIGVLLARTVFKGSDNKRADELNEQMDALKNEHQQYRQNVDEHFEKTSELVFEMTQYYRKVYDHLSEGAQNLCLNPPEHLKLNKAQQGELYDAQPEAEQLAHQQETETEAQTPAEEAAPAATEEKISAKAESENDDDVASETGIELDVKEPKKGEHPTLH